MNGEVRPPPGYPVLPNNREQLQEQATSLAAGLIAKAAELTHSCDQDAEIFGLRQVLEASQREHEKSREDAAKYKQKIENLLKEFLAYKHNAEEQFQVYSCHITELNKKNVQLEEQLAQAKLCAEPLPKVARAKPRTGKNAAMKDLQLEVEKLQKQLEIKEQSLVKMTAVVDKASDISQYKEKWSDSSNSTLENAIVFKDKLIRELEAAMNYGYNQMKQLEQHWVFDSRRESTLQSMFANMTPKVPYYPNEISNYIASAVDCLKDQMVTARVELEKRKRRYSMILNDGCKRTTPTKPVEKRHLEEFENCSREFIYSVNNKPDPTWLKEQEDSAFKLLYNSSRKCKALYEENAKLQEMIHVLSDMVTILNAEKFEIAAEFKRHLRHLYAVIMVTHPDNFKKATPEQFKIQEVYDKLDVAEQIIRVFATEVEVWRGQHASAMHELMISRPSVKEAKEIKESSSDESNCNSDGETLDGCKWYYANKIHNQMLQETVGRQKVEIQNLKSALRVREASIVGAECARDYFKKLSEEHGASIVEPVEELPKSWLPQTPIIDHVLQGDYCYRKNKLLPSLSPQVAEIFKKAKAEWYRIMSALPTGLPAFVPPPVIPMPPTSIEGNCIIKDKGQGHIMGQNHIIGQGHIHVTGQGHVLTGQGQLPEQKQQQQQGTCVKPRLRLEDLTNRSSIHKTA